MLHTVSQGDTIRAEDINQFVEVYQEHPTDFIYGTNRGVLIQQGNNVNTSQFGNCNFKQIKEVVDSEGVKVAVALGDDYYQALNLLQVDGIYSVMSGDAQQLSDWNWYGYTEQKQIDNEKMKPSGMAVTQISDFTDYIYGYGINAKINGEDKNIYVFSSQNDETTKKELSSIGINNIEITDSKILATKTNYDIQNIIISEPYKEKVKQFQLRGIVDTRNISADGEERKQYKWKIQWYSHYDFNNDYDTFGVKFNDKKLRWKGLNNFDTPQEGWNDISASDKWEDEISLSTDVYLNVMVDLMNGYHQSPDSPVKWKYNEERTWYDVSLSALSSQFWCIPGSQVPGSYDPVKKQYDYSDGYWVATSFKLGEVRIVNDYTSTKQIFDGTQTFVAPFYTNLSSDGDGEPQDVPDSEISDVNLSSLYRKEKTLTSMVSSEVDGNVVWDEISTTYNVWRFWDFDKPKIQTFDNLSLSSEGDDKKRSFVIREETPDKKAIVRYAVLSDVITDISGDSNYTEDLELSSIDRINFNKNKAYVQLHDFNKPDSNFILGFNSDKISTDSKYKILVRDDEKKELRYADLSIDFSDLSGSGRNAMTDSELPQINLSSVQRYEYVDDEGNKRKAYMLYNFDNPDKNFTVNFNKQRHLEDKYRVLVRDANNRTLRYADLSIDHSDTDDAISELSANSKTDSEISSILLSSVQRYVYEDDEGKKRKAYMLYNFDNPDNLQLELSDVNNSSFSRYKILIRDGNEGKLKYANFNELLVDSESTGEQYLSLEKKDNVLGLYKWTTDEHNNLHLLVPDYMQYYGSGAHVIEPDGAQDYYNMDILVRNKNGGQHSLDYRRLSVDIPPFVHGDADDYVGQPCKSIESVTNYISPDQSHYQLYNFSYPNATTVNNDLVSGDYYNIANGAQKNNEGDKDDYFLIRNSEGILSYRKIYAKAEGGSWDEQRILSIENSINDIDNDIDNIRNDISNIVDDIRGDIESLSNSISSLSGNYWEQGGNSNTNYGSSIGDSNKNTVINLDGRTLVGNWTAAADFKVNGDITCDNDIFGFNVNGTNGNFNTIKSKDGADITVDNNIDMSNHEIKNASKIGDINLTTKQLVGDWKTTGEHTVDGCINCDWVFKNDGQHNDGVNVGGLQLYGKWSTNDNFAVNGTLTIGSTTITESQLQQLLALIGN